MGNFKFKDKFLETRKDELTKFLVRIAMHPILSESPILKIFMTTYPFPSEVPSLETPQNSSSSGWIWNKVSSITSSANFTKPEEVDIFFTEKLQFYADLVSLTHTLGTTSSSYLSTCRELFTKLDRFAKALEGISYRESTNSGNHAVSSNFRILAEAIIQLSRLQTEYEENLSHDWGNVIFDSHRQLIQVHLFFYSYFFIYLFLGQARSRISTENSWKMSSINKFSRKTEREA